ncbi:hypothetical protein F5972_29325 [Microbispora cellulosiformans]|uniref:Orn/DAP/Arg decarboxylase 2 C-terminal domain-containing protein n=1 Tax=Microbispora cellulosiformans TaxID=2614688 RepID=A0A5J5JUD7_9ACTN|nr:hypothetical protein [Microbispora cellulosiformans]KAA9375062.1 hypothetical protein F5972_29325 [Microbispora cellulosiformans]
MINRNRHIPDAARTGTGQHGGAAPGAPERRSACRSDFAVGDVVTFAMAGAYAWNISHHDFLMHPKPEFHYLR